MAARTKAARKVRAGAEFDTARLAARVAVPRGSSGVALTSWTLTEIFSARDAQLRGSFYMAARAAEAMRTDDALATAFENRLAPQRCIKTALVPAGGARGEAIAREAAASFGPCGVGITADTRASIHACLTNHDVAFGVCTATAREDGSRVDVEMHAWPIEHVRWDSFRACFVTRVDPGSVDTGDGSACGEIPIVHGDGRWVVFQRFEVDPFKHAAILSALSIWARHAYAIRDWAKGSVAHGSAKVIGSLPAGVALQDADGAASPEAAAMLELLQAMTSGDSPAGVKPAGSTVEFLTNNSTAWQVWAELVANAEAAAARVYLGTDGTLGSKGGAPGVDIASLFGVASTKVQGDLECISRGIQTGVIEPWCAMNFGSSELAPKHRYLVPDDDENAMKKSLADRSAAFAAAMKGRVDARIPLTQDDVDGLAEDFSVRAPLLAVAPVEPAALVAAAPPVAALAVRGFDGETLSTVLAARDAPIMAMLARSAASTERLASSIDGVALIRGKDGVDGCDGLDGAPGPQGAEGPQGLPGPRGMVGVLGPAGPVGPPGAKAEALSGAESYAHFTATLVELRKLGAKLSPDMVRAVAERHGVATFELEAAE